MPKVKHISKADVEQLCTDLNRLMGAAQRPWTRRRNMRPHWNVGTHYLVTSGKGMSLRKVVDKAGATEKPLEFPPWDYLPKRELYARLQAYIRGIQTERDKHANL